MARRASLLHYQPMHLIHIDICRQQTVA